MRLSGLNSNLLLSVSQRAVREAGRADVRAPRPRGRGGVRAGGAPPGLDLRRRGAQGRV